MYTPERIGNVERVETPFMTIVSAFCNSDWLMLNFTIAPFRYRMEPVSQITSGHGAPFSNLRAQTISIGPRRPPHTAGVRMIFFVVSSVSSFSPPTAVPNIPYPSSFGFPMVPVFFTAQRQPHLYSTFSFFHGKKNAVLATTSLVFHISFHFDCGKWGKLFFHSQRPVEIHESA